MDVLSQQKVHLQSNRSTVAALARSCRLHFRELRRLRGEVLGVAQVEMRFAHMAACRGLPVARTSTITAWLATVAPALRLSGLSSGAGLHGQNLECYISHIASLEWGRECCPQMSPDSARSLHLGQRTFGDLQIHGGPRLPNRAFSKTLFRAGLFCLAGPRTVLLSRRPYIGGTANAAQVA